MVTVQDEAHRQTGRTVLAGLDLHPELSQPAEVGLAVAVHHAEHLRHMPRRDVDWAFQVRQLQLVRVRRRRNLDLPCAVPRASRPAGTCAIMLD